MKKLLSIVFTLLALATPALGQGTTTINALPAASSPLYCSEVVAAWQIYRTVKIPVALAGAVCQGATSPASPFQGQQWFNTTTSTWVLNAYDGAQWVKLGYLDTVGHTWTPASLVPAGQVAVGSANGLVGLGATGTAHQVVHGGTTPSMSAVALGGDTSGTLPTSQTPAGTSVADPGTGVLESLLPVQTIAGSAKAFLGADLQYETRRSNSGAAMSDSFLGTPAAGLANGARITVNNVDATAVDTITAGGGTTINGGGSFAVPPQRSVTFVYDAANTAWRSTFNTSTMVLGPASAASGNLPSYTDTTGKVVGDSGVPAANVTQGAASSTSGNLASYSGTTGKQLADSGVAASAVVTTTGTQTLTNKTLTAPTMSSPVVSTITGGTAQCLQASTVGAVTGTGAPCSGSAPTPTFQAITAAGTSTVTTPTGATYLHVVMCGAGGGGGGSDVGDSTGGAGGSPADAVFNSIHAKSGSGQVGGSLNYGGAGGTGGTGTAAFRAPGQSGGRSESASGGLSLCGFPGTAVNSASPANSGAGGVGGSGWGGSLSGGGGGGGAEYLEYNIAGPTGTYPYTLPAGGSGGTAGTGGNAGAAGGSAIIKLYWSFN